MLLQSISQITSLSYPQYLVIFEILLGNFAYSLKTRKIVFETFVISTVLLLAHCLLSKIFCWYFGIYTTIPEELIDIPNDRYIIVANHKKAIDPYMIFAALPLQTFQMLLPIRFFTANIFLKHWWQKCFLFPFGSFRAYATEGETSGVKGGLILSDRGQSLFIFPQGKRVVNYIGKLKFGLGYLVKKRDFTILPVYVAYHKKGAQVCWGKPFKIDTSMAGKSVEEVTTHIFDNVLSLSALQ